MRSVGAFFNTFQHLALLPVVKLLPLSDKFLPAAKLVLILPSPGQKSPSWWSTSNCLGHLPPLSWEPPTTCVQPSCHVSWTSLLSATPPSDHHLTCLEPWDDVYSSLYSQCQTRGLQLEAQSMAAIVFIVYGGCINVYWFEFQCLLEQWAQFTCLELLCSRFKHWLVGDNGN